jgi:phage terminase small subunit
MAKRFTNRQRAFIGHYVETWNAAEAARRAGYSVKTARSHGQRLLTNVDIRAEIDAKLDALAMSAAEVLARLKDQAGASMADFVSVDEETGAAELDLAKATKAGKLHLLKKVRVDDKGITIELHDSQAALVHLGRHHGLFTDKQDITSGGQPIQIVTIEAVPPTEAERESVPGGQEMSE